MSIFISINLLSVSYFVCVCVFEQMSTLLIYAFYEMTQQKNLFIEVFTVNYTFSKYKR